MAWIRFALIAGLLGAATVTPGGAAEYGDAKAGLALARQWCAACHVVEEGQAEAAQLQAPTFATVAATLDEERRDTLAAWLANPHGPMKVLSLSRQQIADVLAYIASLKKP